MLSLGDFLSDYAVALLNRWPKLKRTGIWIFDDMGSNRAPMISPKIYERIVAPTQRKMIAEIKAAGARSVILHSDGNILDLLDGVVDVG